MSEPNTDFTQKHKIAELVIDQAAEFAELNPDIGNNQDPSSEREGVFKEKLATIVNRSNVAEYTGGMGENSDLFQLLDKDDKPISILVKVVKPDRQEDADRIENTHKQYVELLGPEFVEDMTRITVTNEQILSKYPKHETIEAYVQDLRALDGKTGLFQFLLENDPNNLPDNLKQEIQTFFERVLDGYTQGYATDLGAFPRFPSDIESNDTRANVLIDAEGISLIDSGLIIKVAKDNYWKTYLFDVRAACLLIAGRITPTEAYERRNDVFSENFGYQVDQETLASEIEALKTNIGNI